MAERYIDPNSGAAPQPGGFGGAAPVLEDGEFDAAVADELTEEQEQAEREQEEAAGREPAKKAVPAKKAPAKKAADK